VSCLALALPPHSADAQPVPETGSRAADIFEAGRAAEEVGEYGAAAQSYQTLLDTFPTSRQARHAERRREWLEERNDGPEPFAHLRLLRRARQSPDEIDETHPLARLTNSCSASRPLCLEMRRFVAERFLESGHPELALSHYRRWLSEEGYEEAQRISWRLGEARALQAIARGGAPRRMHPGTLRVINPAPTALARLEEAGLAHSPLAHELELSEHASRVQRISWSVVGVFAIFCALVWLRHPSTARMRPREALVSLGQSAFIFLPATLIAFVYDPRSLDTMLGLALMSLLISLMAKLTANTLQNRAGGWLLGASLGAHIAGALAVASSNPTMVYFLS